MLNLNENELDLIKDLSAEERKIFIIQFEEEALSAFMGFSLAFIFGGVGAHQFYIGKVGIGIIYLLFCWTFIPAIFSLFEAFFMADRIDQHNLAKAAEIVLKLRSARSRAA